jgi:hypothetical protein
MAEHERDPLVSSAYRGLGGEAPPAALDAAILAASRRRPARWAVPVSIAAVVVLAVGVTLRVQLEEPRLAEPVALAPRVLEAPAEEKKAARVAAAPAAAAPAAPQRRAMADSGARAELAERSKARDAIALGKIGTTPETPEQWLERIARLRAAGQAREADESYAEFKRLYPDYRIPDEMRARIAPR